MFVKSLALTEARRMFIYMEFNNHRLNYMINYLTSVEKCF